MRPFSLRVLLLGAFAYVLVLILLALEIPLALNLSRRVDAEVKAEAAGQAHVLAASAAGRLGNVRELDRLTRDAASELGGRVIVVDDRGRLQSDSAGSGLRGSSYRDRREIRSALGGEVAQGTRESATLGQEILFTAVPIANEGVVVGAVRVTQSVESIRSRVRRDALALAAVGALALLLGLVLAWLLAGWLSGPLRALARAARRVEAGDLDARAAEAGSKEQREVARAFNDMTERLAQALAAQRDFVANASHQLRTPLTGLRLRLEAASLRAGDPELETELAAADAEIERLTRLLAALLSLAREGQRTPAAPIDLGEAAAAAGERWQARIDAEGRSLELRGEDAIALASEEDVGIILDNLLENALAYSPSGTALAIEWGTLGARAFVAVLDRGPGLSPEDARRVFDRFWRGSAGGRTSGSGLGLAIVQTLARRWGGAARLENRPDGGTRAEAAFPAAGADVRTPPRTRAEVTA